MITETNTATNPQGVDDPNTDPQGQAGDSGQGGSAPPEQGQAPSDPKYVFQLTKDLQANPHVLKHKNLNDLVGDYVQYSEKADRLVEIPGEGADDETRAQFFDRLRPASPDDYALEAPDLPDGLTYSKELEGEFRALAHEIALTQDQAQRLHQYDTERAKAAILARQKAQAEEINGLKKDWGDGFDGRINEVQAAFKTLANELGDETLANKMVAKGYGNDPLILKMVWAIWQKIKPDTIVDGDTDGNRTKDDTEGWYPNTSFDE